MASVRTFPSTLINRCLTIPVTSRPVNAYFNLLRRKITRGRDSRSLWGPGDGRGAWREDDMSNGHLEVVYSRRYRSVCRASTRMAQQGASNAFWVHEPRQRGQYQRNVRRVLRNGCMCDTPSSPFIQHPATQTMKTASSCTVWQ